MEVNLCTIIFYLLNKAQRVLEMDYLSENVQVLKGIGSHKAKLLARLKIHTIEDLLYYFPKQYKDKSVLVKIKEIRPGNYYNFLGTVASKPIESRSKRGLLITKFIVNDETGMIDVIFYNNRFAKTLFKIGDEVVFSGKTVLMNNKICVEVPEYEKLTSNNIHTMRIVPEYGLTEGLSQKEIRRFMHLALEFVKNKIIDLFPHEFRKKYNLAEINFSIRNIHFPESLYSLEISKRRLKFEEIFMLQTALLHMKNSAKHQEKGIAFNARNHAMDFIQKLPYSLTEAQKRVLIEILDDMENQKPMNRLLQGDVGSGKTVIGFLALLNCVKSGYQGVMMAPTEILAAQHLGTFNEFVKISGLDIKVELITGSLKAKQKNEILERIMDGSIDIIIGTHALLNDEVLFHNMGLVITDEQHRFGVRQRSILQSKGNNPDMLVMSATPIPRTLSLVLYGDLDISIIDELPPNRKKIETYYINSNKKDRLFKFVRKLIDEGRQAYFVCPLVEESEKLELASAKEYRNYIKKHYFKDYKVGLVYGKMKNDEKDKIMESFKNGETNIIVSTTVIEVGINVPNATIMVIENAERFGLAQLHQLRGRVGRGEHQSYCILISDIKNEIAEERLRFMTKTSNGFEIAEKDLDLRGSGEILGVRQHGLPEFKLLDLSRDYKIIKDSKDAIDYLYKNNAIEDEIYEKMTKMLKDRFDRALEKIALN